MSISLQCRCTTGFNYMKINYKGICGDLNGDVSMRVDYECKVCGKRVQLDITDVKLLTYLIEEKFFDGK